MHSFFGFRARFIGDSSRSFTVSSGNTLEMSKERNNDGTDTKE
jgi:hypothetical protein